MQIPIRRALISVYDKTGVTELATALHEAGCEIISTGSTAQTIAAQGLPVTDVATVTGFPESFDGRVKTLHPKIHGGILANRELQSHREQMNELGIEAIDLVVVNLYPFRETIATGATVPEAIEQIDIGGPAMVRAAAKNHQDVAIVVDPASYPTIIDAVRSGGTTYEQRAQFACAAFAHTAAYDTAIANWMAGVMVPDGGRAQGKAAEDSTSRGAGAEAATAESVQMAPHYHGGAWQLKHELRYGENPHQRAAVYAEVGGKGGIANARQLHGKAMSYNNYQDVDAAVRAAYDHEGFAVAVVKHANPCGVAVGNTIAEAHAKAHACDPVSAYGGVIAANSEVTLEMAQQVRPIFTEVIAAPSYDAHALELLKEKKNLRILVVDRIVPEYESKEITGGLLIQERDRIDAPGDNPANWKLVSGEAADADTLADLEFAWRAIRSTKSNAILLAHDGATVGIGMGQVNRVDSCRLAVERADTLGVEVESNADTAGGAQADHTTQAPERARGAVAASDAFFPFADGFQILADAGVKAVVQPGGSIRDGEVIDAARAAGITMYLTGARHFAH